MSFGLFTFSTSLIPARGGRGLHARKFVHLILNTAQSQTMKDTDKGILAAPCGFLLQVERVRESKSQQQSPIVD